jgi:hypothetical protein
LLWAVVAAPGTCCLLIQIAGPVIYPKGIHMDFNEAHQKSRRKTTKLKDLQITRVDLVDKGANPGAFVMIAKAADHELSHEAKPAEMQLWQVEAIAIAFTDAGATYGDALSAIMKHDPEAYQCYRRENYR